MLPKDRLHIVAAVLTTVAMIIMQIGVQLPTWWILKKNMKTTVATFKMNGDVHCTESVCFPSVFLAAISVSTPGPEPSPERAYVNKTTHINVPLALVATEPDTVNGSDNANTSDDANNSGKSDNVVVPGHASESLPTDPLPQITEGNAVWFSAGKAFSMLGVVLVTVSLILQVAFFRFINRKLQIAGLCTLVAAAVVSYIAGFIFINKFSILTSVYVTERPLGALTYNPGGPACLLIASLMCIVAAVFALIAFHPSTQLKSSSEKQPSPDDEEHLIEHKPSIVKPQEKERLVEQKPSVVKPQEKERPIEQKPSVVKPQEKERPIEQKPSVVKPQEKERLIEQKPSVVKPQEKERQIQQHQ